MSFGFSISDFVSLAQLASRVVENTRKAAGAHQELTRGVSSLHTALKGLQTNLENHNSVWISEDDVRKRELATLARGCRTSLRSLSSIVDKYNGLSKRPGSFAKWWKSAKFGNGEMMDLNTLRSELGVHTSAINIFVSTVLVRSLSRVEAFMAFNTQELNHLRQDVNKICATRIADSGQDGSVLTTYADDDKHVWKDFRRELYSEGYSSAILRQYRGTIMAYIKELGNRGILDGLPDSNYLPDKLASEGAGNTARPGVSAIPQRDREEAVFSVDSNEARFVVEDTISADQSPAPETWYCQDWKEQSPRLGDIPAQSWQHSSGPIETHNQENLNECDGGLLHTDNASYCVHCPAAQAFVVGTQEYSTPKHHVSDHQYENGAEWNYDQTQQYDGRLATEKQCSTTRSTASAETSTAVRPTEAAHMEVLMNGFVRHKRERAPGPMKRTGKTRPTSNHNPTKAKGASFAFWMAGVPW